MALRKRKADSRVQNGATQAPLKIKFRNFWKSRLFISIGIIVIVALAAGIFYYVSYVAPFRQAVLTVDDAVIRMDYFLKRVKIAGGDPSAILEQLTYELIVNETAYSYGIEVSQVDIDQMLRNNASSSNAANSTIQSTTSPISESEFEEWYDQQLESTGLSDSEYKEIIKVNILATRLRELLASEIPATAEQIHLNVMALASYDDAQRAKTRVLEGETFADVASEVSVDSLSRSNGGDLGWIPRGVVPYDDVVFQLELGRISDPVLTNPTDPASSQYALFLVVEKSPNRIIDPYMKQILGYRGFYEWLEQELQNHEIEYRYDSETQAWIDEQLNSTQR